MERAMSFKVWLSMSEFMRFTYDWERFIQPLTGLRLEYKGPMEDALDVYDYPVSVSIINRAHVRDLDVFEMILE